MDAQELRQKKRAVLDKANGDPEKILLIPNAEEIRKDVEELMGLVHGAVKARLQLGFDNVSDEPYSLKPIIKDL